MAKMDIGAFVSDTKGGSNSQVDKFDFKAKGKAIIYLHPKSGIFRRDVHWFPVFAEVMEDNKKVKKIYNTCIVHEDTKSCLICQLRRTLRENEDIDMDETILTVGEGDEAQDYNKGEIIGAEGYGWKKNIAYKTEYLFGLIDAAAPDKVWSFTAPKSLGKKITKVIEDQIEEEGEEDGNPFKNPYAIKLTYDKAAQSTDMYDAKWNKFSVTDEIQDQLDSEGVSNEQFTIITQESKVAYLLKQSLIYDVEELGLDLSAADDFDPKELNRTDKADKTEKTEETKKETKTTKPVAKAEVKSSKPVSKPVTKVNKKEEIEDEEEVEEVKTSKPVAKTSKPVAKPVIKKKQIDCPECGKMIDEDVSECKFCGVEFEDSIECPSCGKDIPSDSTVCPECSEEVSPF